MKSWLNLKVALGVSVFVNLFLMAAFVGAVLVLGRHMHDLRDQMPREMKWEKHGDHAHDQKIFGMLDEVAALGEADMRQALALRAEAAKIAQSDPFDKAKVLELNTEARRFENAAREKVETAMVAKLSDQPKEVRAAVLGRMMRPGFRHRVVRKIVLDEQREPDANGERPPPPPPENEGR